MSASKLEAKFKLLWNLAIPGAPRLVPEFRFHPKRKWRFDFCDPARMVAIEIEGGVWSGGRHTTGYGFIADCDKYNEATMMGWKVIRITTKQINIPYLQGIITWMRSL